MWALARKSSADCKWTSDESQGLRGRAIEPLLVVNQADQRLLRRHVGQQAQDGQADQEPVRCRPGADAERRPQRITLRSRQLIEVIEHRRAQLLQSGERQLHLRLDAGRARHPAAGRLAGGVVQQGRLADARLAGHHQRPALARPDIVQQLVQHAAFAAPACQPGSASSRREPRTGLHSTDATRHTAGIMAGRRAGRDPASPV
jgi:hypothetical protein